MKFKFIVKSFLILLFALQANYGFSKEYLKDSLIKEISFDFGEIHQNDVVSHIFSFQNTTDTTLLVLNAIPQCGCTTPEIPKEAFNSGDTIELLVKFDSSGKMGYQRKVVRVVLSGGREVKLLIFAQIID